MTRYRYGARPSLTAISRVIARFLDLETETLRRHFRPAEEEHLGQILNIRQGFLDGTAANDDATYLRWRYRWESLSEVNGVWDENRIWMFEVGGQVLGFIGVETVELSLGGQIIPCLKLMDLAVAPNLDGRGLGVWMNLVIQERSRLPVITLGSNKNSIGLINRVFHRMPDRKVYRNLLRSRNYSQRMLKLPILSITASKIYDVGLRLWLEIKKWSIRNNLSTRQISRFTVEHEEMLKKINGSGTRVRRTVEYLNWRLLDKPDDPMDIMGIYNGSEAWGYIAYLPPRRNHLGQFESRVQDWTIVPGPNSIQQLSWAFIGLQLKLIAKQCEYISLLSYDAQSHKALRRAKIHLRDDTTKTFAVYCSQWDLMEKLAVPEHWFLTGADADDF